MLLLLLPLRLVIMWLAQAVLENCILYEISVWVYAANKRPSIEAVTQCTSTQQKDTIMLNGLEHLLLTALL